MVSAGESVEVTLPRNEVELNAFVVPPSPPSGKTMETGNIFAAHCSLSHFDVTWKYVIMPFSDSHSYVMVSMLVSQVLLLTTNDSDLSKGFHSRY